MENVLNIVYSLFLSVYHPALLSLFDRLRKFILWLKADQNKFALKLIQGAQQKTLLFPRRFSYFSKLGERCLAVKYRITPWLVCLSPCLSLCRPVCLSVCPSACLPACLSVCLYAGLSACLSVYLPACLPACLSLCLPVCLPLAPYSQLDASMVTRLLDH